MAEEQGGWEAVPRPVPPRPVGGLPADPAASASMNGLPPEPVPPSPFAPELVLPGPGPARAPRSRPSPPPQLGGPAVQKGSLRLFRLFGIDVFVHWSWAIAAYLEYEYRPRELQSPGWFAAEYLALFGIVLLHEFGHALACRQVGGKADRIYLWPLGGVAFVNPPPRPEAYLWSLAAGPLVNLVLVPITLIPCLVLYFTGALHTAPAVWQFLLMVFGINLALLIFNMLPIFPLDGGQIVHALLWAMIGRARSLLVVTILSLVVASGGVLLTLALGQWWLALMAGFAALSSLAGFQRARGLLRILNAPRHEECTCPGCGTCPPRGPFWVCGRCMLRYDTFAHDSICPRCGARPQKTMCPSCAQSYPFLDWYATALPAEEAPAKASAPASPFTAAPRDVPAAAPAAPTPKKASVTLGQRLVWAAVFAVALFVPTLLVGGKEHLSTALALAAGGVLFGATSAEGLSRFWRTSRARSRLNGTWRLIEQDGKDLRGEDEPLCTVINGQRYTQRRGKEVLVRGDVWADPSREPKTINLTPRTGPEAGKTYQGIYEIEGKQLTICYALAGGKRPTDLRPGLDRSVLVFRRGK